MVAAEMHQALLRIQSQPASASGLTLPSEFHALVEEGNEGCLVYLEPLRKEETLARYGAPAFEIALRQLALRLRSKLPAGGALCRRSAGDYIAYLPHLQEQAARNWANEAAATASLIGIAIEEGRKRVPLAVRAKVARIGVEKEVAGLP